MLTVIFWRSPGRIRKEQFRFRINAANGEQLAQGEGYAAREDARRAVSLIFTGEPEGTGLPSFVRVQYDESWQG